MSEKIPIKKTTYNKGKFSKVIDTQFRELNVSSSIPGEITIEDFFRIYENLILDIAKEGNINSHRYILNREAEYLGVDIEEDEDIQNLLQEITDLREQLVNIKRDNDLLSERMSLGMGGIPSDDYLQENAMEAALFGVNAGLSRISSTNIPTGSLISGLTKDQADGYYHPLSGSLKIDFNADKLKSKTLIIPNAVPVDGEVGSGEIALYAISAGFSGEIPSGSTVIDSIWDINGVYPTGTPNPNDVFYFNGTYWTNKPILELISGSAPDLIAGSIHYIQNQNSSAQDADYWIDGKAKAGTLIIPAGAPDIQAGETALYSISAGFSGQEPSGAGSVTNIGLNVGTTQLRVSTDGSTFGLSGNIADDGTFTLGYATGYTMVQTSQTGSWDNKWTYDETAFAPVTGSIHYIQNQTLGAQDADYWIDGKAKAGTLIIPTGAPGVQAGETALYSISAGFSGQEPSGAGSLSNIAVNTSGGIQVAVNGGSYGTAGSVSGDGGTFSFRIPDGALGISQVSGLQTALADIPTTEEIKNIKVHSASSADVLSTPRAINVDISGVTGSAQNFDGSAPITIPVTLATLTRGSYLTGDNYNGGTARTWAVDATTTSTASKIVARDVNADVWVRDINASRKVKGAELIIPTAAPTTLASNETALYSISAGFSGETPSGAGSLSNITVNTSGGIQVGVEGGAYGTTGTVSGDGGIFSLRIADGALSILQISGLQTQLDSKMTTASYPDLVAIESLSGTSGFLKKTDANTWSLDTNTYFHSGNIGSQSVNYAASAGNADMLDTYHASYFATAAQLNAANLSNGYLPYWNNGSLGNSPIYTNATNIAIGVNNAYARLTLKGGVGDGFRMTYATRMSAAASLMLDATENPYWSMVRASDGVETISLRSHGNSFFLGGNVGIGTTNPASYDNIVTLTIGDNSLYKQGLLKFRSSYNSGDGAELWQRNDGLIIHNINSSVTAYTIQSNGNFGIGYTDKSEKLAVNGSGYFNGHIIASGYGYFTDYFILDGVTNAQELQYKRNGQLRWDVVSYQPELGGNTGSNYHIYRYDDNGNYLDLALSINRANGNVAIGANSVSYNYKLYVNGSGYFNGKLSSTTLIIPNSLPSLEPNETALYAISAGFSGQEPSGGTIINSIWDINGVYPTGTVATGEVLYYNGTVWTNKLLGTSNIYGLDTALSGYALASHNHSGVYIPVGGLGLMSDNLYSSTDTTTGSNFRTSIFGSATNGNQIKVWRWNNVPPLLTGQIEAFSTAIVWAGADTHAFLGVDYHAAAGLKAVIGGGNSDNIRWTANLIHSGNIGSQSVTSARQISAVYENEDNTISYATKPWHNWAQFSTPLPGEYKYGLHIGSPDANYNFQLGMSAGSTSVYLRTKNVSYNTWQKIWTDGNLTNTLSNGYLPYWNNGSLANSGIKQNSNEIIISGNVGSGGILKLIDAGAEASIAYRINGSAGNTGWVSGNYNDSYFIWSYTKGAQVFNAQPNGNIGIGYTTDQGRKLAVNGDGYFNGRVLTQSEIALLNGGGLGNHGAGASSYPVSAYESYGWNFTIQEIPGGQFGIWNASRTTKYFSIVNGGNAAFSGDLNVGTPSAPKTFSVRNIMGYGATFLGINPWGGNVSIGWDADQGYKLAVNGSGYFNGNISIPATGNLLFAFQGNETGSGIYWKKDQSPFVSSAAIVPFYDGQSYNRKGIGFYTGDFEDFTTESVLRMVILRNGNVGIGYSTGTEITNNKLAVNGSGYFNGNLGLGAAADVRLSVSGDAHISNILYMGGTAGSYSSWGSRTLVSAGHYSVGANSFEFNNYGYGATWGAHFSASSYTFSNNATRSTIRQMSSLNIPTDFYMGVGSTDRWSITTRDSYDGYNLKFYSTSGIGYAAQFDWSNGIFTSYYGVTAPTITASTELKIGAGWSAIQNGSNELELKYGGERKAAFDATGVFETYGHARIGFNGSGGIYIASSSRYLWPGAGGSLSLGTSGIDRIYITGDGFTKMSNTGYFSNVSGAYHEILGSSSLAAMISNEISSGSANVLYLRFAGMNPDDSSKFLDCYSQSGSKFLLYASGRVWAANYIETASYLKGTSVKIGANWEAIPNGNDLDLRFGGVLKARIDSSGNITAVGGVTAFAI